jgi:hypothetical protein
MHGADHVVGPVPVEECDPHPDHTLDNGEFPPGHQREVAATDVRLEEKSENGQFLGDDRDVVHKRSDRRPDRPRESGPRSARADGLE